MNTMNTLRAASSRILAYSSGQALRTYTRRAAYICPTCRDASAFARTRFVQRRSLATEVKSATSTSTFATIVHNPQKNEAGNVMQLEITKQAADQLHHIAERDKKPDTNLRVTVESGGCHGFQYLLDLTEDIADEDVIFERDGAKVVIDPMSLEYIQGSTIDYTTELIGSQFKIVDNPQAKSGCGCGTSFEIDMDKL